ncbi:hypothetical protein [Streptomyces sp. RG80]|uniref:Lsr2 family DNA-binding protein n=1 Tax=Streptomyces sp. RG80 TaxID=3157340 RepID=UPI0033900221
MTTDLAWQQALAADARPLRPTPLEELAAAARVTARHASDKHDLAELLDAIGAPTDPDTLTALLPHLPDTASGDHMTTQAPTANAYAAAAVVGHSPDQARDTLGLSDTELAEAVKHSELPVPTDTPDPDTDASTSEAVPASASDGTVDTDGIEALLSWAESHPAASIRNRATRVRSDLAELTERRATDAAQRAAEERVAKAKAELEAAQAQLRAVKAGGPTAAAAGDAEPLTSASPPAATLTGKRSKEELAAIREWARANGHQVAGTGTPARKVLDAYDAAHRTTNLAEAS